MTRHRWIGAVLLGLTCFGCGPEASFDDVDPRLYEATPSYAVDIEPLMTSYCVSCHDRRGVIRGGVELETYEKLRSAGLKSVCVAVQPALIQRYGDQLRPLTPPNDAPCGGTERWVPYSMPTGAKLKLTPPEQVIFVRWLVTGAAP